MKRGADWLKEHFLIDLTPYDAVIGYRADDSYFSFARAFVNNEISLTQLSYAIQPGKLGEQFVLKSPAAFERIQFVSYELADNTEYYAKRKTRDDAMKCLGEAMDYAANSCQMNMDHFLELFIGTSFAATLLALSKVLGCHIEDLLEYDTSEIEDEG